jgi:hypothetical protein
MSMVLSITRLIEKPNGSLLCSEHFRIMASGINTCQDPFFRMLQDFG